MTTHQFDLIIVGAGGAGLRAAVEIPAGFTCAVLTKVHPLRSHTGAAQGGVCAALGNLEEDNPEWHAFDTIKGSDYLGDQDAIEVMCNDAPRAVIELEHMGMPFSRTDEGKIAQRRFGGHTRPVDPSDPDSKRVAVMRSCYSADRTGHTMLHTLYENSLKNNVRFFSEFFVTELLYADRVASGVVAIEILTGEVHVFHAKAVMFATGGDGRIWRITSMPTWEPEMALCWLIMQGFRSRIWNSCSSIRRDCGNWEFWYRKQLAAKEEFFAIKMASVSWNDMRQR